MATITPPAAPPLHQPPIGPTLDTASVAGDTADFQPYIRDDQELPELTPGGILLGVLLGLLFAASSVYLALKVGLTVSASIPIAVLSITIFRYVSKAFGRPTSILQNNIVQTTGSAGESIAAGTVFTLPALLLLGYALPLSKVAAIALVGGLLGVLLMIPLRRSLIVKEHRNLKYPEGTACAEVLIVGEQRGVQAKTVFQGFGLGALYEVFQLGFRFWAEYPSKLLARTVGGRQEVFGFISAELNPALAGVGYIIGSTIAGYLFAGGLLSFFVLIPIIKLFGASLAAPIFPATKLIADMSPAEVRANYVYYIGAGGVTTAGLISLVKGLPTIWQALSAGFGDFRGGASVSTERRTMREIPMPFVLGGIVLCGVAMVLLPQIHINPLGAVLAIFFSFLFVTVSSRITGQIGASANPISGMTVAAVLLTSLIFLGIGWTRIEHRVLALSIAGVVCVSAAVAGATSQDLKTGHLVGATPRRQQIGLLFGVVSSAILIGWMINFLNDAKTTRVARSYPGVVVAQLEEGTVVGPDSASYRVGHLYEPTGAAPAGRYLVDQAGAIHYLLDPGIGGREPVDASGRTIEKLDSPKAQIMALVVDGILTQKLPWGLILIGAFFAIAMEILGLPSLAVSVGVYLPISTSATMFLGGAVRWLVERRKHTEASPNGAAHAEGDSGPGVLFSSGLIAGGAIMGVVFAGLAAKGWDARLNMSSVMGALAENALLAITMFALTVLLPLYLVARRTDVPPSH